MYNKLLTTTALLTVIASPVAFADQVISDDLIVIGNTCVGNDCANTMVFGTEVLRLRENNTRINFFDNSAADALGKSWLMIANDSMNGGHNYFKFEAQSLTKDTVLFSDGTYPQLDCSGYVAFPLTDCVTVGQLQSETLYLFRIKQT